MTKNTEPDPTFMIIGGMKCGTTTLHAMLDSLPGVFMPKGEMKFFSIDDIEEQRPFFRFVDGEWSDHDFDRYQSEYLEWYRGFYASKGASQVAGEDAPSYLPSVKVPSRLAKWFPTIRLVVLMRDPVNRAWSHYWHNVRAYRATYRFEDAIQYEPDLILSRSCYKKQVERYLQYFPRKQFLFLPFEKFVERPDECLRDVCDFIGVAPPEGALSTHVNVTTYPRFHRLALFRNRFWRNLGGIGYERILPRMQSSQAMRGWRRVGLKIINRINRFEVERRPEMNEQTRRFLGDLFRRENEGLDELTGVDWSKYWNLGNKINV